MNIPTAKEAREKIAAASTEKDVADIMKLETIINKAIGEGKESVSVDFGFSEAVRKLLKTKGYIITHGQQYNQSYTTITWGETFVETGEA